MIDKQWADRLQKQGKEAFIKLLNSYAIGRWPFGSHDCYEIKEPSQGHILEKLLTNNCNKKFRKITIFLGESYATVYLDLAHKDLFFGITHVIDVGYETMANWIDKQENDSIFDKPFDFLGDISLS